MVQVSGFLILMAYGAIIVLGMLMVGTVMVVVRNAIVKTKFRKSFITPMPQEHRGESITVHALDLSYDVKRIGERALRRRL